MSTPTEYDLIQDAEIEAIREITTTSYTPPDSAEVSFPVVNQPMNDEQWGALAKSWGSGIISFGQWPYRMFLDADADQTNQIRISPATDMATKDSVGVIEGFAHRLLTDKVLTVPAVTTRTRYLVALQYDPVRAEQEGTPIILDVFAGELDQSQGKKYVLIHEGYRDPSTVLSQMSWTGVRSRLAPTISVDRARNLPDPQHSGLIWGSRCRCTEEGSEWMLTHHPTEEYMMWEQIAGRTRTTLRLGPNRVVSSASRAPKADLNIGLRTVTLYGGVRRDNGNAFTNGTEWSLARLPTSLYPNRQYDYAVTSFSTTPTTVRVSVRTDGDIQAYVSGDTTAIHFDGLTFPLD